MEAGYESLFLKHFAGETSEDEEKYILTLISEDKSAMEIYNELKDTWEKSAQLKTIFDSQKAYQEFKRRIDQPHRFRVNIQKVAAIFIALISISALLYIDYVNTELVSANNEKLQFTLPDSSVVFLNKNAKLEYRKSRIWGFDREVVITGEAFFEVKHHKRREFKVFTSDFQIVVLGTEFNVVSNARKSEITLEKGKVRLIDKLSDMNRIELNPGEQVCYNKEKNIFEKKIVNPQIYSVWKENKLILNNFDLIELAKVIEIVYGKKVIIQDENNQRLSGSAPIDDLDALLLGLSEILYKSIIVENDTIIIK